MSAAVKYHVGDNYQGTFLTMWSTGGIVFGIINIVSDNSRISVFSTVFLQASTNIVGVSPVLEFLRAVVTFA